MLRKRKNKKYNETNDEEGAGGRKFNLKEQIRSKRFDQSRERHLQELNGNEVTLKLIQRNGFEKPILVIKPDGLDLTVPPKSFLVRDVRDYVGHDRIIDVMDVKTQKNMEMPMKDWCKYYESKNRDRLLNVISLEFSLTELDELVKAPMIVRLLDWVDLVWPKFLKESQTESTNTINKMKYPKVQKYCLMSVKGSYTDFHIDFGGTSVWYHILRGKKIFWMVSPTELNLQIFEEWTLSGMQQDVFFGDTVEECFKVELTAGNTFFIPSGWIHAVYTVEDSLVFGGNFLHSFGIENQLKVSKIEDATKVPLKFRYPFYTEILWYVAQHYVYCLTDKDHLHRHEFEALAAKEKQQQQEEEEQQQQQQKKKQAAIIEKNNKKIEIEDETTESEQDYSDNNNKSSKKKNNKKKNSKQVVTPSKNSKKRGKPPPKRAAPPKKKKKPASSSSSSSETEDDDSATDIDSASEELAKPSPKVNTTCRMTKNSLLRLQYEVEEKQQQQQQQREQSPTKSNKGDSSGSAGRGTPLKKKLLKSNEISPIAKESSLSPSSLTLPKKASTTLNLTEIMLSHESKLNGWTGSGQTIWSNPNLEDSKETKKIHLTRYEINGLKLLVKHLSKLSGAKKNLPTLIRNSRALLDDCRKLAIEHENDDPELAITGLPITPELLRKPKKTDMNELIGQFFKPIESTTENNDATKSPLAVLSTTTSSSSPTINQTKSKSIMTDSSSITSAHHHHHHHHHKIKSSIDHHHHGITSTSSSSSIKGEPKSSSPSNSNDTSSSSLLSSPTKSSSPTKETKCLSPNKKLSTATTLNSSSTLTSASSSTSSPPIRPKSPPTRPLSNNQYTSKTKNNNNLLLPGSFADLIAATSTEKKVFDVSGTDVTSSLFGVKDLKLSPYRSKKSNKQDKSSSSSSMDFSKQQSSLLNSKQQSPLELLLPSTHPKATSSGSGAGAGSSSGGTSSGSTKDNKQEAPISPNFIMDSSKATNAQVVQKRFINPTLKPAQQQNKEKLIYASAPYVSPVQITDPSRSIPYPWQTPAAQHSHSSSSSSSSSPHPNQATHQQHQHHHQYPHSSHYQHHQHHHQQQQQQQQQPPPSYSSSTPKLASQHSVGANSSMKAPYAPADFRQGSSTNVHQQSSSHVPPVASNHNRQQQHLQATDSVKSSHSTTTLPPQQQATLVDNNKIVKNQQFGSGASNTRDIGGTSIKHDNNNKVISNNQIQSNAAHNSKTTSPIKLDQQQQQQKKEESEPKVKKPTKPRGPPKKSKEARQVAELNSGAGSGGVGGVTTMPTIPLVSVIKVGPSSTSSTSNNNNNHLTLPSTITNTPATTTTTTTTTNAITNVKGKVVKEKRQKKAKNVDKIKNSSSSQQANIQQQAPMLQNYPLIRPQAQQSVICSIVGPSSTSNTGARMNSPSYMITQPLLFNTMPTFSAAQFQYLSRAPMPLFTSPVGSQTLGLPSQQGARIVWATPPRNLQPPTTTTVAPTNLTTTAQPKPASKKSSSSSGAKSIGNKSTPEPTLSTANKNSATAPTRQLTNNMNAHPDNAALLSLATTALSTAPMTSSPTLSQLSNRGATRPQAIMVSQAAVNQPAAALFAAAGQQFLRPFMPQLPMTQFITQQHQQQQQQQLPGTSRPACQLVYARLPNQGGTQPRLFFAPPGFMQQRFQATPSIVPGQAASTLAYAAFKNSPDTTKALKSEKVKTS